jgi:glycosyltransferase involved in cell wall biosynthesis
MVSILLAVYNGEKYLKFAIDSILKQTFTDFELLIGFNGTVDKSKDIVNEYTDNRIRVFDYGMEAGKSRTLNKLLNEAKGDWLAIQDDDDIWISTKLEKQILIALKGRFDVIGSNIIYIDKNNRFIGFHKFATMNKDISLLSMSGYNQVANTTIIFRKSIINKIGGWDECITGIEDYDFWLKLMNIGSVFYNINEVMTYHRLHAASNFNINNYDLHLLLKKYSYIKKITTSKLRVQFKLKYLSLYSKINFIIIKYLFNQKEVIF